MRWFLCGWNWIKPSVKRKVWLFLPSLSLSLPLSNHARLTHPTTIKHYRKRNLITWLKVAIVNTIKRIQLKFVRRWQQHSGEGLFVEVEFDLSHRESRPLAEQSEMDGEWEGPQSDPSNWILNWWILVSKRERKRVTVWEREGKDGEERERGP